MAITTAMSTSLKVELLKGLHDFSNAADVFKCGLFKTVVGRTYDATTTNYSEIIAVTDDELANGSGYTTAGFTLTNVDPASSGVIAFTDWSVDPNWTSATFVTDGCFIYNTTNGNATIAVFDFGGAKSVTSGTLTVQFPVADSTTGIIRLT